MPVDERPAPPAATELLHSGLSQHRNDPLVHPAPLAQLLAAVRVVKSPPKCPLKEMAYCPPSPVPRAFPPPCPRFDNSCSPPTATATTTTTPTNRILVHTKALLHCTKGPSRAASSPTFAINSRGVYLRALFTQLRVSATRHNYLDLQNCRTLLTNFKLKVLEVFFKYAGREKTRDGL